MLKTAISLAVASVPEGLPTIATTTLALGMRDMRKRHIIIRGLNAVEALGSVQTICLDKTGTITRNQMVVAEVHIGIGIIKLSGNCFIKDDTEFLPSESKALSKLLQVVVLCSESEVITGEDGKYEVKGSATENALIYMAIAAEMDIPDFKAKHPLIKTYPRTENRNIMTTVHKSDGEKILVAVKGSPEEVLQICTSQMKDSEVVALTKEDKQALGLENERMAGKALRVLGVAYAYVENLDENPERDLIWLGLTGMADPIREGVADLMEQFHQARIDTVMITGDQSPTAYAIAKELHLNRNSKLEILDSSDLAQLGSEKLQALCEQVDVFARVSPADKLQIVQALQAKGKIVAMTGDGINDTPALKAANVGIAMGSGKADVVREVADVVIEDDRLETMINAVSRGRTIYSNIRKSVHFLLSTNLSEIIVTTAATALGLGEPLNTMQLLWLNLVSDIFPGLALAMEAPEPEVLNRPPRNPDQPIIKRSDFERIAVESGVISVSALSAYSYGLFKYGAACNQTETLIPLPIWLAHKLARQLDKVRQEKILPYLAPDGKTQVGVEYRDTQSVMPSAYRRPYRIHSITIVASQDEPSIPDLKQLEKDISETVIKPAFAEESIQPDNDTHIFINPDGIDSPGGPASHSGLTGRKNAIDTYGEYAKHSGAALSGKDPIRIDRVAAYAARYAAKNIVAANLADECEIQLSYTIGQARPVSIEVETFGTGKIAEEKIIAQLQQHFDFRLAGIIRQFNLRLLPSLNQGKFYQQLASYGHMGRMDLELPWEKTDKISIFNF
ncbi:MAG: methionine adenosyltransferase domain-containing protein [Richelia sp. RM2_1_2]|nr:methionine adenosyltransferase domain-containing protein [Richelia sp. RM2_1_2]